nr:MAG TPA: hypothetical protein [Caudoviricetes sp.]
MNHSICGGTYEFAENCGFMINLGKFRLIEK